jgi:hypothetical protein
MTCLNTGKVDGVGQYITNTFITKEILQCNIKAQELQW